MDAPAGPHFSLVRGGPFHRLLRRAGLVGREGRDLVRVAGLLALLGWLPLVLLSVTHRMRTGEHQVYLMTPSVHVRFLVVLPLLVAAMHVLDGRCAVALRGFVEGRFTTDPGRVAAVIRGLERLRDSSIPELLFLAVAVTVGQEVFWGMVGPMGLADGSARGDIAELTSPRAWYGLVALPLFLFYSLRVLWMWVLWALLLLRLSRLPLEPIPLHPDRAGGLAPLGQPVFGYLILVSAVSCLVSSTFYDQVLAGRAHADAFIPDILMLAVLALAVGLGPLLCFAPVLAKARLDGLNRYGAFGVIYTRDFLRKWIVGPTGETPLGTSDIQSLADLGNSFNVLYSMRAVPFGARHAIGILLAVAVPMAPLVLTEIPLRVLLRDLGQTLIGSVVP